MCGTRRGGREREGMKKRVKWVSWGIRGEGGEARGQEGAKESSDFHKGNERK